MPGPVIFDGTAYHLSWSAQPSPVYTKQEYLPEGQSSDSYTSMIMVEVLTDDLDPMTAAAAQMNMLKKRKATDPLVNMELIQNESTGGKLLDFILSAQGANGEIIVEWNAYRYTPHDDGVLLFGVTYRAYGNEDARSFLENLASLRPGRIEALANAALPDVAVAR